MLLLKRVLLTMSFLMIAFTFVAPTARAKANEFEAIVSHLQSKYQAKKLNDSALQVQRFHLD